MDNTWLDTTLNQLAATIAERVVARIATTASPPTTRPIIRAHRKVRAGLKLNADQVGEIRRLRGDGWTFQELADAYHVSTVMISHIVHRRSWRDVP